MLVQPLDYKIFSIYYFIYEEYVELIASNPQHLERDILYKSIYWFLYMNDNFIAISDCKYVHITGFNQRQLLIST